MGSMKELNNITTPKKTTNKKLKHNRQYKDSVFVDLFSVDKTTRGNAVMAFYNALHDEKITSEDEIRFVRLKNLLFPKIRNDVSFIAKDKLLVLLEHQSTVNDNIPFRCLEYVVSLYQLDVMDKNKFSNSNLNLFTPEFYVIYNGKEAQPAKKELLLSKLFKHSQKSPKLELVVTVININHPDNKDFMLDCPLLDGYRQLVEKAEEYLRVYGEDGFAMAIEECIKNDILGEYLKRKTEEVTDMFSVEYSYALALEASKEDGIREGIEKGKIETAKSCLGLNLPIDTIAKITGLTKGEIERIK